MSFFLGFVTKKIILYCQILCKRTGQVDERLLFLRREHGHSRILRPRDMPHDLLAISAPCFCHTNELVSLVFRYLRHSYIALRKQVLYDKIDRLL